MVRILLATALLVFAGVQTSFAGPLEEAQAQAHRSAIAAGDLEAIMQGYAEDAYMDWVGGPLDGRYQGKSAIRAVWQKFIAANAGQPRPAKFGKLAAYTNPKGTSVNWEAEFAGTTPVKAWHTVVYREGSLASEIWQIAPALQVKQ